MPLFALRGEGDQGIGDTRALKELLSWCRDHSIRVLQILPVNETSADNSPYNAVSSLALEPTTLSLRPGDIPGLSEEEHERLLREYPLPEGSGESVNYRILRDRIRDGMQSALKALVAQERDEFLGFCDREKDWLEPYATFRALMEWNHESPVWTQWPEAQRSPDLIEGWMAGLPEDERQAFHYWKEFFSFCQWVLDRQWKEVRQYADLHGVELMGDIPFGVSRYSSDVWGHPDWFMMDWSGGAPPEPFFQHDPFVKRWGQNWGIPPYRWEAMEISDFSWWRRRIRGVARYFHCFRIDHILGFYRLYCFPWLPERNDEFAEMEKEEVKKLAGDLPRFFPESDENPEGAEINQKAGEKFLRMVLDAAGDATVVGEDLGMVPDYVRPSLEDLGISGFKIPIFEKDDDTGEYKSFDTYTPLSVTTLSTHDHMPMLSMWKEWWQALQDKDREDLGEEEQHQCEVKSWEIYRTQRFLHLPDESPIKKFEPTVREAWLEKMLQSPSWLAIAMITDLFGLEIRFNVPGPISESNWSRRMPFSIQEMRAHDPWSGIAGWFAERIRKKGRG